MTKKDKGANKKMKDEEKEMLKRHELELKNIDSQIAETETNKEKDTQIVQSQQDSILPFRLMPTSEKQISRAAQKKLKKQQKNFEKQEEFKKEIDKLPDDERTIENRLLTDKLQKLNKQIQPILSDGHCLFRAISAQLRTEGVDHIALRKLAASYIRNHKNEFLPFLIDENGDPLSDEQFAKYCNRMENVSSEVIEWGGHSEIVALAKALKKRIHIYSANGENMIIQHDELIDENHSNDIHLSFHKHYYGLGNHYNSVINQKNASNEE